MPAEMAMAPRVEGKEMRRMDTHTVEREEDSELGREPLQAIETGWGPKVESALLMELLKGSLGLPSSFAELNEVHVDPSPLADLNAYKHRLQALRSEYAGARLRGLELEEQLAEARLRILDLDTTLAQIYASRFWKFRERLHASLLWKIKNGCARCWQTVSRWLLGRGR
jgi:hypothetical protein